MDYDVIVASVAGEIAADLALEGATGHDISMFRIDRFTEGDNA
jgi:hypothetical protein